MTRTAPLHPTYSSPEQWVDNAVHITGVVAALIAVPVMVTLAAVWHNDAPTIAAATVYGLGLIAMLAASAGYHLVRRPQVKELLRRCDHAAIYIKIAATYTPFTVLIGGAGALWLLAGIWGAAVVGLALKVFAPRRYELASVGLYLAMGWAGLIIGGPMIEGLTQTGLVLIIVGGALYTIGVGFHLWHGLPYQNAIWHGLVLAASFVFYAAVLVEVGAHAPD